MRIDWCQRVHVPADPPPHHHHKFSTPNPNAPGNTHSGPHHPPPAPAPPPRSTARPARPPRRSPPPRRGSGCRGGAPVFMFGGLDVCSKVRKLSRPWDSVYGNGQPQSQLDRSNTMTPHPHTPPQHNIHPKTYLHHGRHPLRVRARRLVVVPGAVRSCLYKGIIDRLVCVDM